MKNTIQPKISLRIEVIIILFISLGYLIYTALRGIVNAQDIMAPITFLTRDITGLLIYELSILFIIIFILRGQGKSFINYGFTFSITKATAGLILFIISYIIYLILYFLFSDWVFNLDDFINRAAELSAGGFNYFVNVNPFLIITFSIVNSVFEEFILVGYIVTSLKAKKSLILCVVLSVGLRLSYHVYQGSVILFSILPMGILFTLYFWYKRSLTPLIIAHAIIDILSLSILMAQSGK